MQNACANDQVEVITFKSGKFLLTRKCDSLRVTELLIEATVLYQTINDLPILPDWASQLDKELMRRSIHGTAAIEGNPLNEEQVDEILSIPEKAVGLDKKASMEITNLKKIYDDLDARSRNADSPLLITEDYIKYVHKSITENIRYHKNDPGVFRNHKVEVGDAEHGGKYIPPRCLEDIKKIIGEFVVWINGEESIRQHPFIRAAIAHYHLGTIHPFGDGNGRTARLLESAILASSGIKYIPKTLSNYYYQNVDKYYNVFREVERSKDGDITPFIAFVLAGIIASVNDIKGTIKFHIRTLVLRDYFRFIRGLRGITKRQHDLLELLLNGNPSFRKKDLVSSLPFNLLYRGVSEDTMRRDLKKLKSLKFIIKHDDTYLLNYELLG